MEIPDEHLTPCPKCGSRIITCRTTRRSKGEWVTVDLESQADTVGGAPGAQWFVTRLGTTYHAGQPTNRNQRSGMLSAGQVPHREHAEQCARLRARQGASW